MIKVQNFQNMLKL